MNRRGLLRGILGLLAAPAIVRVASIMPVSAPPPVVFYKIGPLVDAMLEAQGALNIWRTEMSRVLAQVEGDMIGWYYPAFDIGIDDMITFDDATYRVEALA